MEKQQNIDNEPLPVCDTEQETEEALESNEAVIDIGEVLGRLEAAETKAAEYLDKYQRTLAEFDNFRKRTLKEKSAAYDDGAAAVILGLLTVIDSFERALNSCADADRQTPLFTGIELIYKQLEDFMQANNIKAVEAVGQTFDPELHSAIAHVDDDSFGESEIVEDMQKGYIYKDKVLRHSIVKVAN